VGSAYNARAILMRRRLLVSCSAYDLVMQRLSAVHKVAADAAFSHDERTVTAGHVLESMCLFDGVGVMR
jgi:hypothetical protein